VTRATIKISRPSVSGRDGATPHAGRDRMLMVAEGGLRVQSGMELRGRELHDAWRHLYRIAVLTKPRWHRWWFKELSTQVLCGRIRRVRPDLVYLHKFGSMPAAVLETVVALSVPIVARFGDCYATNLAAVRDRAQGHLTLVFNSRYTSDFYLPLFPSVRHHTIYTGVDTRAFRPPPGPSGFVFLGRTLREKGFLDFCDAMTRLPSALVSTIDIIGQGADLKEGLRRLRAAGRQRVLRSVGPQAHAAIPAALRKSAILVMPSAPDGTETLSTAVVEGMACGLGVVATDVAGTAEAVRHEETGLLVPPGDVGALADACRRLAQGRTLCAELGRAGRRLVEQQHDRAVWLRSMTEVIESVRGFPSPVR
jgi:glycosyltransferase involved in cell wall biosynthesis